MSKRLYVVTSCLQLGSLFPRLPAMPFSLWLNSMWDSPPAQTGWNERKPGIATLLVATSIFLGACSNGTIYKKDQFGNLQVLSIDARQRLVLQGKVDGEPVVCTEPSPDAIVAQAAHFAAAANATLEANKNAAAQLAGGTSEAAASIAMRTQTIQLLRDGYFRLCEARLNNVLTKTKYIAIISFIDEFIATVVAIEAIGGTVQTPPVAIFAGGSATVAKDKVEVEDKPLGDVKLPDVKVDMTKVDAEKAKQIAAILKAYYARKERFQLELYRAYASSYN